ncbi:ABC transporter permease [Pelagibacterium lacus]|uniref:ABC transporter permease n=1 Tax=Pelagibacterium lacus TaxID=2282655 RepID=UPI0018F491CC|nr:ABC transporter permease [Pelagibacterium lacus]
MLVLFFLYPLAEMIRISFADPQLGLQNYSWFFSSEVNVAVTLRTFWTAFAVALICLLIAYPYAYVMSTAGPRLRTILLAVVLTPLWTSLMVRTLAWIVLLQDSGIINDALEALHVGRVPLIRTTTGVIIGMSQMLLPFMVLPLYSVMSKIDPKYLQAAAALGARPLTAFFKVYLPMTKAGVFAGSLTVFVLGLGFYIIPALLGSPRNTMLSALIQQQVGGLLQWGRGSAMGVILLVSTILVLAICLRLTKGVRLGNVGGA